MKEVWKTIDGFDDMYGVSDHGFCKKLNYGAYRYRFAAHNGIALPCAYFVLSGIVWAAELDEE